MDYARQTLGTSASLAPDMVEVRLRLVPSPSCDMSCTGTWSGMV